MKHTKATTVSIRSAVLRSLAHLDLSRDAILAIRVVRVNDTFFVDLPRGLRTTYMRRFIRGNAFARFGKTAAIRFERHSWWEGL